MGFGFRISFAGFRLFAFLSLSLCDLLWITTALGVSEFFEFYRDGDESKGRSTGTEEEEEDEKEKEGRANKAVLLEVRFFEIL